MLLSVSPSDWAQACVRIRKRAPHPLISTASQMEARQASDSPGWGLTHSQATPELGVPGSRNARPAQTFFFFFFCPFSDHQRSKQGRAGVSAPAVILSILSMSEERLHYLWLFPENYQAAAPASVHFLASSFKFSETPFQGSHPRSPRGRRGVVYPPATWMRWAWVACTPRSSDERFISSRFGRQANPCWRSSLVPNIRRLSQTDHDTALSGDGRSRLEPSTSRPLQARQPSEDAAAAAAASPRRW